MSERAGSIVTESMRDGENNRLIHDMTIDFMQAEGRDEHSDSDDDFREFEGAEVEEAEDRIYQEYKKHGRLDESAIQDLAGNADVSLLE